MGQIVPKPIILWLADGPNWAYASIVKQIGGRLPQYTHDVEFMVSGKIDINELAKKVSAAAVVVPMYVPYMGAIGAREKVALFLSGMRPFE